MNNARQSYERNDLRVARLLAWLNAALERHEERAADFVNEPARLWPMVGKLAYIEQELIFPLMLLSGQSEKEINQALNDGGADND